MEKTVRIESWKQLLAFVNTLNPYKKTMAWSGYINRINEETGELELVALYFTTKPVDILKK